MCPSQYVRSAATAPLLSCASVIDTPTARMRCTTSSRAAAFRSSAVRPRSGTRSTSQACTASKSVLGRALVVVGAGEDGGCVRAVVGLVVVEADGGNGLAVVGVGAVEHAGVVPDVIVDEDDRVGGHGHVSSTACARTDSTIWVLRGWYAVTVRFGSTIALYTRVSPMSMRMRCGDGEEESKTSAMGLESMCTAYRRSAAS